MICLYLEVGSHNFSANEIVFRLYENIGREIKREKERPCDERDHVRREIKFRCD